MFIEINEQLINVDNITDITKREQHETIGNNKYCIDINLINGDGFIIFSSLSMRARDNTYEKIKSQLGQCNIVKKIEL